MKMIGANYTGDNKCFFSVWAPLKKTMTLHVVHPADRKIEMIKDEEGYFSAEVMDIPPGARYFYMPNDEKDCPDPASNEQPDGVNGPSSVVDHNSYQWNDQQWKGIPFNEFILYELHIGTFTQEGTFEAAISKLDALKEVGINAIEIMPVSQFPGTRNWGYDGAYPYAPQNNYGGPEGLKKLVDACHQNGIAVILDVVYNHFGPEGNYTPFYAPYFTERYHTPWGNALNYDDEYADGVRDYVIGNALYWMHHYHIDGLRLDAIHAIFDQSAVHIMDMLNRKVKELQQQVGRSLYVIAESDLNSPHVIRHHEAGGFGFTAQWLDDFHHSVIVLLDEKSKERYADFGRMEQVAKAYTDGFVHSGEYVNFRKRKFGASSAGLPGDRFIVFMDNHDQSGNRTLGERLASLIDTERQKIAAAALLLSPYIPMLFMGEEYGEEAPFLYFVDHSDPELIKGVREGRKKEFEKFSNQGEPKDAFDEKTFLESKLNWEKRNEGKHQVLLKWYRQLIELRRTETALRNFNRADVRVDVTSERSFILHRQDESGKHHLVCFFNLSDGQTSCHMPKGLSNWSKLLDSRQEQWMDEPQRISSAAGKLDEGQILMHPFSVIIYKAVIKRQE
jgi:maltooligosyltrehalose trehalohydrolase